MPLAKKCSRCGNFYDHYPNGSKIQFNGLRRLEISVDGAVVARDTYLLDLCKECMSSFNRWMTGGKFDECEEETE